MLTGLYIACHVDTVAHWDDPMYLNIPKPSAGSGLPRAIEPAEPIGGAWQLPRLRAAGSTWNEEA